MELGQRHRGGGQTREIILVKHEGKEKREKEGE